VLAWRSQTIFPRDEDWLFANPATARPYHQDGLQQRILKPAVPAAGIGDDTGWHTFRHTYRSWLDETGAPMKVQQELMHHASIQTTMNVYGQAMTDSKRHANSQVVSLIFGVPTQTVERSEPSSKFREFVAVSEWGQTGTCRRKLFIRNLLIFLVAGAGFEPATFGL
jgi:hypothetical protein